MNFSIAFGRMKLTDRFITFILFPKSITLFRYFGRDAADGLDEA